MVDTKKEQPVSRFGLTKTAQQPVSQNDTLKEIFMIPWGSCSTDIK